MEYTLKNGDVIQIDEDDLDVVNRHNWQTNERYVFRTVQRDFVKKRYYLHREILNAPEGYVVDHINGDPSDNRRENIRVCTVSENNKNRRKPIHGTLSEYKGVRPRKGRFEVALKANYESFYVGTYDTEIEAAIAYNLKATEHFGEFARLNVIPPDCANIEPKRFEGTSPYRGVMFHKRVGKWQSAIQHDKKRQHIGYFETADEAALAYNDFAVKLHGSRAKLNVV